MNDHPMTALPQFLSDEAAFALSEALHWLAWSAKSNTAHK